MKGFSSLADECMRPKRIGNTDLGYFVFLWHPEICLKSLQRDAFQRAAQQCISAKFIIMHSHPTPKKQLRHFISRVVSNFNSAVFLVWCFPKTYAKNLCLIMSVGFYTATWPYIYDSMFRPRSASLVYIH